MQDWGAIECPFESRELAWPCCCAQIASNLPSTCMQATLMLTKSPCHNAAMLVGSLAISTLLRAAMWYGGNFSQVCCAALSTNMLSASSSPSCDAVPPPNLNPHSVDSDAHVPC